MINIKINTMDYKTLYEEKCNQFAQLKQKYIVLEREMQKMKNTNNENISQLKTIIENSTVDHKKEIMKKETLKCAHVYCKINSLSGQVTGPLIESFIGTKYNMKKNNASSCVGDLHHNGVDIEVKASLGGKQNNKFNYVQLRMNHTCEYMLTAYHVDSNNVGNRGELYVFRLNKNDLKEIVLLYGGYAHGTVHKLGKITKEDLDDVTNDKEYAIRPKYGDKCWQALLKHRDYEFSI